MTSPLEKRKQETLELTLGLLYGEQGDGAVFVEHGTVELFASPSIYGFSDEGDEEVRAAYELFARVARDEFGVDAVTRLSVQSADTR